LLGTCKLNLLSSVPIYIQYLKKISSIHCQMEPMGKYKVSTVIKTSKYDLTLP
jgi:hypothetical protein